MTKLTTAIVALLGVALLLGACAPVAKKPISSASSLTVTPNSEDIEWLATAIASEAGSVYDGGQWVRCTDEERAAVGWTVINRLKAGTYGKSIKDIVMAPNQYAHNQQPIQEISKFAKDLLEGKISDDTKGATYFFSPISMPKEGEATTGFDTGGGLYDIPGISKKVYFPSWTKTMVYAGDLKNVRKAYFMFYRDTRTTPQPSTPMPTPSAPVSPAPAPTQSSVVKGKGIEGVYIGCPESKDKIEVSHSIKRGFNESSYFPTPQISVTVKNISDKSIEISGDGEQYNHFYLKVSSMDKNKKALGDPKFLYYTLMPKEVESQDVELFSSDETKGYEIRVDYNIPPLIIGRYIESPDAMGKIKVNHYVKTNDYNLSLMIEVTNISSETLGKLSSDPPVNNWYVQVNYKDASDKIIGSKEELIAECAYVLNYIIIKPGETRKVGFSIPKNTSSYEITVVKKNK